MAWVLRWQVDYEGDYMIGVYATRGQAEDAATDWWRRTWGDLLIELWEGSALIEGHISNGDGGWRDVR